ncbi:DNA alkylation repair protein [Xanthovirga aplysinae]|uniref:DNA alkylation repair protein n=1 Tax=Xanthovirga aplysinae TaxID=2529853 RepID=UPI0016573B11|nr:DNA alkylation repair protein [Xanthovirga aplysinae]
MKDYIDTLTEEFARKANPEIAMGQKAYMRNQFEFFGIKTTLRREIQRPFFAKESLPPKEKVEEIVKILWSKAEREYQFFSQELAYKYRSKLEEDDIKLFEYMVTHKSWWDTVDFISSKLMGDYLKRFPGQREIYVEQWIASKNKWLQRSALLFQLNYKEQLDADFLGYVIQSLLGSNEFFINKAIGWILRQYSRTNPSWVVEFANKTQLHKLSHKEALRLIK